MSKNVVLTYAEKGYRVLPLTPNGKAPLLKHGVLEASNNPQIVYQWLKKWPTCNIGLAAGANSLHVLDIDTGLKNGRVCNGLEQLAELEAINGKLPLTLKQHTPSGGLHLVYRVTSPLPSYNLAESIDTRGEGGYIAISPSTINGKPYQWERHDIQPLPQWIVTSFEAKKARETNHNFPPVECNFDLSLLSRPGFINNRVREFLLSSGNKHEQDMVIFCALVARGLSLEEVEAVIYSYPAGEAIKKRKPSPSFYMKKSYMRAKAYCRDIAPYRLTGVQNA